jgi:hypothetical protein
VRYSGDRCSIGDIADFLSCQVAQNDPKTRERREQHFKELLVTAWWLGELGGDTAIRIRFLRGLYRSFSDEITFTTMKPGGRSVRPTVKRPVVVPLPTRKPKTWTEGSCVLALESLAAGWATLGLLGARAYATYGPLIWAQEVERSEFVPLAAEYGLPRPRFWQAAKKGQSSESMPRPRLRVGRLEVWYRRWVKECEAAGKMPSRDEDVAAVRAEFGRHRVRVRDVYAARRKLAPTAWHGKGRRARPSGKLDKISS